MSLNLLIQRPQLELKTPGIFDGIESMEVDFDNPDFAQTWIDPYANLHQLESEIREKKQVAILNVIVLIKFIKT